MRALVLDDDAETREVVVRALSRDGFDVASAASPAELEAELASAAEPFALFVFDVMLDGASGLDVCRDLRRRGVRTPVLFLSARGAVDARVDGLEAGADDYLAKPFAVRELVLRARALARRGEARVDGTIRIGELTLDFDRRVARAGESTLPITAREWEVLRVLAMAEGRVVPTETLLERVWGEADDGARASLDVILSRIRRKLDGPAGTPIVRTVRGNGYALDGPKAHGPKTYGDE